MTDRDLDHEIDVLFAAARDAAPDPSADLLARVLADAGAVQAGFPTAVRPAPAARPAGWRLLWQGLGGWGAVGGMLAAGLTGLWIGFSGAGALGTASAGLWNGTVAADTGTTGLAPGAVFDLTLALEG